MASLHHKSVPLSCLQIRDRYEKMLEDVTSYTPRYMEEMEAIFEQSQEEERKRISFLKQAFLSIHRHLDITNNERWAAIRWLGFCKDWTQKNVLCDKHSVSWCQREGSVQWAPSNSDDHQWAGWSTMVEEQPWSWDAHRLAKGWGTSHSLTIKCRKMCVSLCRFTLFAFIMLCW